MRAALAGTACALLVACNAAPPPPASAPDVDVAGAVVRFVALGDAGEGNGSQRKVARVMASVCAERGCDFGLLLGDNLYPRGMDSPDDADMARVVDDIYAPLGIDLYAVLGNHDYAHGRDDERAAWQIAWARERSSTMVMPSNYYAFSAGPADLFALDTTFVFWHGHGDQRDWLREGLASSDARWKVVFGHHPLRSNGQHGNAGRYEGLPTIVPYASGRAIEALLSEEVCGVADLYLSGHEHNLQWISACGTELIVSGSGAKATPLVDRGNEPRFAISEEGFAWVELGEQMTVAFYTEDGALQFEQQIPR